MVKGFRKTESELISPSPPSGEVNILMARRVITALNFSESH